MIKKVERLPLCFSCEFEDRGLPCRDRDGKLLQERLAKALLVCCQEELGTPIHEANWWAIDCVAELVEEAPYTALRFIVFALKYFERDSEIDYLAAGPLEDLLENYGNDIITIIEDEAVRNERFRFLLSGVWGEPTMDSDVWRRLQIILEKGPWLNNDPRTPQGSRRKGNLD